MKDMPRLQYVPRGIKSDEAKALLTPKQRLPVTPALLMRMYSVLQNDSQDFNNIMIWAASLVCFFGFMCSGKISIPSQTAYDPTAHLNFTDISVDDSDHPSYLSSNPRLTHSGSV